MTKSILILGGLSEFVGLVEEAAKEGLRPIVVDGNPDAPAKARAIALGGAAYTISIDQSNAIADLMRKEDCCAITTAYSDILFESMVKIASCFPDPKAYCPITMDMLPYYRDKEHMKEAFEKCAIPSPKSVLVHIDDPALPDTLRYPLIVKPRDAYGSRGVAIVEDRNALSAQLPKTAQFSKDGTLLVEEYNDEYEFNAQAFVHSGKVFILGIADRETTKHNHLPLPISTRNIYPSRLYEDVFPHVLAAMQKYVGLTGQNEGPLSMQFFWGPKKGFEVCEIAARFLGYEHELLSFANNIRLESLLIAAACFPSKVEMLLESAKPEGIAHAAVLYFHGRDGIIADDSVSRNIPTQYKLPFAQFFYNPGERIGSPQREPYVLRYFVTAKTRAEVDDITKQIFADISVKDAQGEELLYRNQIDTREAN